MPYSRTRSRQKSRRRARLLLYVNLFLIVALFAVVGVWGASWLQQRGEAATGAPPETEQAAGSPTAPATGTNDSANAPESANGSATDSAGEPSREPSQEPSPEPSGGDSGNRPPEAGGGDSAEPGNGGLPGEASGPDAGGSTDGPQVTLAFVGDILPAARVGELMDKNGVDYPFAASKSILEAADITAGNLEAPITERGTPAENKKYVFKGKPEYLAGLKNAGFDIVSLANNHTLDQGWEGLSDTMDHLNDAGIQHVGAGRDDTEAFTPVYIESNGITVAYIGVTNIVPVTEWKADKNNPGVAEAYDLTRSKAAIQAARKLADVVVVMVHWGEELNENPVERQTDRSHAFIDAGADLVIGSHPHILQGFESYKGKWIAYSLGNFVFTSNGNTLTQQTGVLNATCGKDGGCSLAFVPMFAEQSQPAPMVPIDSQLLLGRLDDLSIRAEVDELGNIVPAPDKAAKAPQPAESSDGAEGESPEKTTESATNE
ncbi:CapA family protein [Cohnella algarum]|uniref:CapA family protein n=1 Tax=Cohnella algarum TaxID=2044859 RepID=UPI001F07D414|nr:CapA family protein [Cohnella algarum]